jgi:hypothetical protein
MSEQRFAIAPARNLVNSVEEKLMWQYRKTNHKEKIAQSLLNLVDARDNEVLAPFKNRLKEANDIIETLMDSKPSESFASRLRYLFTGKL